jgi:hypothetical protein
LIPAPRRALESNERLKLTHRLLRGQPGGAATAGDVAYLRGDVGTALCADRNGVVERPRDDAAWAGLALVSGQRALREWPEVVAAVYRALGGPDQDPLALARWMSSPATP